MKDKFNILSKFISNTFDTTTVLSYFDNYLINDTHTISLEYIRQIIYHNTSGNTSYNQLCDMIVKSFQKYIINTISNINIAIKRNAYNIQHYETFISKCFNKIDYIDTILSNNSLQKNESNECIIRMLKYFNTNITENDIIIQYVYKQIYSPVANYDINVINIFMFYKQISSKYKIPILYSSLINGVNLFLFSIEDKKNCIVPDNYANMLIFKDKLKLYNRINTLYHKIEPSIINNFGSKLIECFIKVIDSNNLNMIDLIYEKYGQDLYNISSKSSSYDIHSKLSKLSNIILHKIQISHNNITLRIIYYTCKFLHHSKDIDIFIKKISSDITPENITNLVYNINDVINNNTHFLSSSLIYFSKFMHIQALLKEFIMSTMERLYNLFIKNSIHLKCNPDLALINENLVYIELKKMILPKSSYIISKLLSDTKLSLEYNDLQHNYLPVYNFIATMVLSYEVWNINYASESCILKECSLTPTKLYSSIVMYITNFDTLYSSNNYYKKLCWYLHYGEITVSYCNKTITMLPIQFIIFEFFNDYDSINIDDIMNFYIFKNYSNSYIYNVIDTLVSGNLLTLENTNLILNTNNEDIISTNLIDIYNLHNTYKTNIDNVQSSNNLAHDDLYIILTNIRHILKTNQLNYDDLYNITKTSVNVIKITPELFNTTINYMIDNDYICLVDNIYENIYY